MWSRSRSPLRYPGSKARFAPFIARALELNGLRNRRFIEPFCGAASVSIALLEVGLVSEIALNDADPAIAAFWATVFDLDGARWLAGQVLQIPLTLEEWDRQKRMCPSNSREAALRCLYLNRTSFNGILQARGGPIGGRSQKNRTLGVRFNREWLATRIAELSTLHEQVVRIGNEGWAQFMLRFRNNANTIYYLDPPFYHKAERLYVCCFDAVGHRRLRDSLRVQKAPWLLSYDDAPEVRDLYGELDLRSRVIDSTYSTHPIGGGSFVGRELFYTNLRRLPAPGPADAGHEGLTVLNGTGGRRSKAGTGPVRRPHSADGDIRRLTLGRNR
ncbi:MAG: DNA adenine methylase [Burkholderiales bacterium]